MKNAKALRTGFLALLCMLMVILDAKHTQEGMANGISMCIQVVIPSLFPFIFLSQFITNSFSGTSIPLLSPVANLCGIPAGSENLLILSAVGGYPIGAQAIFNSWKSGSIDTNNAKRLLGFCSNAGPSFIFGLLGRSFSNPTVPWLLWLIQIASSILVGALLHGKKQSIGKMHRPNKLSPTKALFATIRALCGICGWVILFRVLLSYLDKYILCYFPLSVKTVISGMLELSNGCILLAEVPQESFRFVISTFLLSFGGICVLLQTRTVTEELGTGMYFPGKLLQACISTGIAVLVATVLY